MKACTGPFGALHNHDFLTTHNINTYAIKNYTTLHKILFYTAVP